MTATPSGQWESQLASLHDLSIRSGWENSHFPQALSAIEQLPPQQRAQFSGLDTACLLSDQAVDPDLLSACLLADPLLVETWPSERLTREFGKPIETLVRDTRIFLAHRFMDPSESSRVDQAERSRRMLLALVDDVRAAVIGIAFRVVHLRQLRGQDTDERRQMALETQNVHAPLANRLGLARIKWELEDLAFHYLEPAEFKSLARKLEAKRVDRERYLARFKHTLEDALKAEGITADISGRPKHIFSIRKKMRDKALEFEDLHDLLAVRLIVGKLSECYAALGIVHAQWRYLPDQFDDYIANRKKNGYQSLHTAIVGPEGRVVEVQIRTREMHATAELGVAAHWLYKELGNAANAGTSQHVEALRNLLENSQDQDVVENLKAEVRDDHVFVLTPQREIHELPKGATPLDFAYSVHTDLGHRCRGAKVNGRIVPLTYALKNGERVDILSGNKPAPSRDWMNPIYGFLVTAKARAKVRYWFKHLDDEQNARDGKQILEKLLTRLGAQNPSLDHLAHKFNLKNGETLYAAIGRSDISDSQIANALNLELHHHEPAARPRAEPQKNRRPDSRISIAGAGGLLTQIAGCCKPAPGDPIRGFITKLRGVSIHRAECKSLLRLAATQPSRIIDVDWGGADRRVSVDILIEAFDRQGLLRDISSVISNEKINLLRADTLTQKSDQRVRMSLTVEIDNIAQLNQLLDKLGRIPHVHSTRRAKS